MLSFLVICVDIINRFIMCIPNTFHKKRPFNDVPMGGASEVGPISLSYTDLFKCGMRHTVLQKRVFGKRFR